MAWDFQTEPEFQEQLDWTARFVREEIWPIEPIADQLDQAALERIYAPLQQQVKARGLRAAHLDPELGGQGFGQLKLGLLHEILGSSPYAPNAFGCQAPDSGNSEIRGDGERLPGGTHWRDRPLGRLRHHPNRSAEPTLAATGNHESSPPHLARNQEENG
jgi:hypothetical protein